MNTIPRFHTSAGSDNSWSTYWKIKQLIIKKIFFTNLKKFIKGDVVVISNFEFLIQNVILGRSDKAFMGSVVNQICHALKWRVYLKLPATVPLSNYLSKNLVC